MILNLNDNVLIELIEMHHAEPLLALVNNNNDHLSQWLPWVPHMRSVENFQNFIAASMKRYHSKSEVPCIISVDGKVAGRIGLYSIDNYNMHASVGYWIGKEYEGKGIITKAAKAMIDHGFRSLDLNRIEIRCGTGNHKSQAIPERLGFKQEGILRQAEKLYDKYIDLYLYSMLKDEWRPAT